MFSRRNELGGGFFEGDGGRRWELVGTITGVSGPSRSKCFLAVWAGLTGHGGCRTAGFGAFFDPGPLYPVMSALRDALRDLPDAVFADLLESDDAYLVVLDLPGVSAATLDVTVDRGRLRIEARREKSLPGEYRYLTEERSLFLDAELPLPPDATGDGAEATMRKGVLELHLPKSRGDAGTHVEVTDA